MSYEYFISSGLFALFSVLILCFIDKELKYRTELGLQKNKLVLIKHFRFLFSYKDHRKGIITRFVLINMILFYLINLSTVILIIIQLINKSELLFMISVGVSWLNFILFLTIAVKLSLSPEKEKIKTADQKRRRQERKMVKETQKSE